MSTNKICTLLLTGKEKRYNDKIVPLTPIKKRDGKVAALLRKPSWPVKHATEQLHLA